MENVGRALISTEGLRPSWPSLQRRPRERRQSPDQHGGIATQTQAQNPAPPPGASAEPADQHGGIATMMT